MTLQTRKYATERVERYRRKLGFSYRGVELTDARRWGIAPEIGS
jgi:IMP dehydrogenase/GMP reductase